MMDQGLVQIGYSMKVEDILAIESHGHIPFEILYQMREAPTSFQIPFQVLEFMAFNHKQDVQKKKKSVLSWGRI